MTAAFFFGAAVGSIVTAVVWVAYFAPKHWEWYQDLKDTKSRLADVIVDRDHYKNLTRPNEWGAADQHEARIVPKTRPWEDEPLMGDIKYQFDDIQDGGER